MCGSKTEIALHFYFYLSTLCSHYRLANILKGRSARELFWWWQCCLYKPCDSIQQMFFFRTISPLLAFPAETPWRLHGSFKRHDQIVAVRAACFPCFRHLQRWRQMALSSHTGSEIFLLHQSKCQHCTEQEKGKEHAHLSSLFLIIWHCRHLFHHIPTWPIHFCSSCSASTHDVYDTHAICWGRHALSPTNLCTSGCIFSTHPANVFTTSYPHAPLSGNVTHKTCTKEQR